MPEQPPPTPVAPPPEEGLRPDPLASAVADAVAKLRRAAGLSERAAARRLGTSQTQLRRMEDPRYLPSLRSLARVAAAYGYRLPVEVLPRDASRTTGVLGRRSVRGPCAKSALEYGSAQTRANSFTLSADSSAAG